MNQLVESIDYSVRCMMRNNPNMSLADLKARFCASSPALEHNKLFQDMLSLSYGIVFCEMRLRPPAATLTQGEKDTAGNTDGE